MHIFNGKFEQQMVIQGNIDLFPAISGYKMLGLNGHDHGVLLFVKNMCLLGICYVCTTPFA